MTRTFALLLAAALGCTTPAPPVVPSCRAEGVADLHVGQLARAALDAGLDAVARSNAARAAAVERLFREAGCTDLRLEDVKRSALPNVICRLPGRDARRIVVGAHYDKVVVGEGAADNWSGAALLPALYASLATAPREHTFEFIAFADEERGLIGSASHVRGLSDAQRAEILGMVNLDTLGLGETKVEKSVSDERLLCLLVASIGLLNLPFALQDVPFGTSDHEPFREVGVPAISIHSLDKRSIEILHSRRDTLAAIDRAAYYDTYRLVAAYLAVLDASSARGDGDRGR